MPHATAFALDGQGLFFMGPRGPGAWSEFDITDKQSADGKVVLKMTMSGATISRIALLQR